MKILILSFLLISCATTNNPIKEPKFVYEYDLKVDPLMARSNVIEDLAKKINDSNVAIKDKEDDKILAKIKLNCTPVEEGFHIYEYSAITVAKFKDQKLRIELTAVGWHIGLGQYANEILPQEEQRELISVCFKQFADSLAVATNTDSKW